VLDWEGFDKEARARPGWMHPAVFVLTAACYSWDMEVRRLGRGRGGGIDGLWACVVAGVRGLLGGGKRADV
jgi:hypothetical protein